jgi:putative heme-binding domain-containing protein
MPVRVSQAIGVIVVALGLAAPARAQLLTQDHPGQYTQQDITTGNRVYVTQCTYCHGRDGDQVSGVDLRRGQFRRAATDEDLARVITRGTQSVMPPFALQPPELLGIVAFIRAGFDTTSSVAVGDAVRGRAVFEGKGDCGSCHRVNGRGSRVAPDLSQIGLARTPAALTRTLVDPSSAMWPINRPVTIVTTTGQTIRGRRLNEDTQTVQVLDDRARLVSLDKRDISTLEVGTTSRMPSYADRLTSDEMADVVGYLLTLRTP